MFARMLTVKMRPGSSAVCLKLARRWYAGVATLPHFVSVSFFGDDETGEFGYFSVWETREAANNVLEEIGTTPKEALMDFALGQPEIRIFQTYEVPG